MGLVSVMSQNRITLGNASSRRRCGKNGRRKLDLPRFILVIGVLMLGSTPVSVDAAYYGKWIGQFFQYAHKVSGKVFAVDEDTLFIEEFTYDGLGPGKLAIKIQIILIYSTDNFERPSLTTHT